MTEVAARDLSQRGILQDIDDAVRNRDLRAHGSGKNRWDTRALRGYSFDTYSKKCSYEWIRQILQFS